jgi:hypothetical protein
MMNSAKTFTNRFFMVLRWTARIIGSLFALFLIFMLLAYIINPEGSDSGQSSIPGALVILIFGLWAVGVGVAWKWEGIGGLIILTGSILFFAINPHDIWPPMLLHIMPLLAILFLLCWLKLHSPERINR